MSPVEKLEAAIAKLERQRSGDDSEWFQKTVEEWTDAYDDWRDWDEDSEATLTLIKTLHRTIDAQLDLFREVLGAASIEQFWPTLIYTQAALALADAILGDPA